MTGGDKTMTVMRLKVLFTLSTVITRDLRFSLNQIQHDTLIYYRTNRGWEGPRTLWITQFWGDQCGTTNDLFNVCGAHTRSLGWPVRHSLRTDGISPCTDACLGNSSWCSFLCCRWEQFQSGREESRSKGSETTQLETTHTFNTI